MEKAEEVKVLNIYQKMLEITNELGYVAKGLTVTVNKKGDSYKAVSETDILIAVKPLETKYNVYSYPFDREIVETKELTNSYGGIQQFLRIKTTYRFINTEDTKNYLDIISYSDGIDGGDKATGKAMTYGDKYALMKAYKISTGDDPDKNASESYTKKPIKVEIQDSLIKQNKDLDLKLIAVGVDINSDIVKNYLNETAQLTSEPRNNTEMNRLIRTKENTLGKKTKKEEK
jgi:hypothetical protein